MLKNVLISLGGLASALGVFMSWCCLLPVALGAAGAGVAAFGSHLEPYRPWLTSASIGFLGLAFFQAYRPRRDCAVDEPCAVPEGRRRQRIALWMISAIAVVLMTFPYWVGFYYLIR